MCTIKHTINIELFNLANQSKSELAKKKKQYDFGQKQNPPRSVRKHRVQFGRQKYDFGLKMLCPSTKIM